MKMNSKSKSVLSIVIPTFREPEHVRKLLLNLSRQSASGFDVFIVNSDPGDETTTYVRTHQFDFPVHEVEATRNDFWAAAVAKGMRAAVLGSSTLQGVLVLNCDIEVSEDLVHTAIGDAALHSDALICYAASSHSGAPVSSGVRMRSWPLSMTRHIPQRRDLGTQRTFIPAQMLAGRALLVPTRALETVGLPAYGILPHYGADYEYTRRAQRRGYRLVVATSPIVVSDTGNTGSRAGARALRLSQRLALLTSIRSPSNLLYLTRFVIRTYPALSVIPGLISTWAKTLLEVLFGRRLFSLVSRYHVAD